MKPEPQSNEPWSETRVAKTMWPPQPGTRRLREEHGAKLVCVRYRHDPGGQHRYTTVELMIDHAPVRHRDDDQVWVVVRIPGASPELRAQIRAAGGQWQRNAAAWLLTRKAAIALGLWARMKPVRSVGSRG